MEQWHQSAIVAFVFSGYLYCVDFILCQLTFCFDGCVVFFVLQ